MRAVHFLWSEEYGACDECSLPAAFFGIDGYGPGRPMRLCAICAANLACDGLTIARIDAEEYA